VRNISSTRGGYGQLVVQRYGPVWGWFAAGDLLVTNLVTLIAEFVVLRVGLAYFHLGAGVAAALGLVLVVVTVGVDMPDSNATARSEKRISIFPNGQWCYGSHMAILAVCVRVTADRLPRHGWLSAAGVARRGAGRP